MDKLRLFVALDLPEGLKQAIGEEMARIDASRGVRWASPQQVHLTLKFLGHIEEGKLQKMTDLLAKAARPHPPMRLRLHGSGAFPSPAKARVLWLGISGDLHELEGLASRGMKVKAYRRRAAELRAQAEELEAGHGQPTAAGELFLQADRAGMARVRKDAISIREKSVAEKQPMLDEISRRIANQVGGRVEGSAKTVRSIMNKVLRKRAKGQLDYNAYTPKDHARTSIIVKSGEVFPRVIRELLAQGFEIEDTTETALNDFGYRGLHATRSLGDGINGEIQLHTEVGWLVKKASDKIYQRWRDTDVDELGSILRNTPRLRRKYHRDAARSRKLWDDYWGRMPLAVRSEISAALIKAGMLL